jgi:hypothetical protein
VDQPGRLRDFGGLVGQTEVLDAGAYGQGGDNAVVIKESLDGPHFG